jgi:hypothetical protein
LDESEIEKWKTKERVLGIHVYITATYPGLAVHDIILDGLRI